jgi:hypothetical protein
MCLAPKGLLDSEFLGFSYLDTTFPKSHTLEL